jgi:hypothetical protein
MTSIRLLPDHHHHISLPRNTILLLLPSIVIVACSIIIICVLPFAASFQLSSLSSTSIANHFTPLSLHHRRHHRILPTSNIGDGAGITTNSNHIRINNNNININMSSNHDDNVAAGTTTTAPPSSSSSSTFLPATTFQHLTVMTRPRLSNNTQRLYHDGVTHNMHAIWY